MRLSINDGLDIIRREAKGTTERTWKAHHDFMLRAERHVEACGGCWEDYASAFKVELQELMEL